MKKIFFLYFILTIVIIFIGCEHGFFGPPDNIVEPGDEGIITKEKCNGFIAPVPFKGNINRPALVWAMLKQRGDTIRRSIPIYVEPEEISNYYLDIPLNGLTLNNDYYNINLYVCDTIDSYVGDVSKCFAKYIDAYRYIFPDNIIQGVNSIKHDLYTFSLSNTDDYCVLKNNAESFTVQYFNSGTTMKIISGVNANTNILWGVGGNNPLYNTISPAGVFTASSQILHMNDCVIFAYDTIQQIYDSLSIIVIDQNNQSYSCDQSNREQKHAGVYIDPGPSKPLVGVSGNITSKYGILCNGTDTTQEAASVTFINVGHQLDSNKYIVDTARQDSSRNAYAEIGCVRYRFIGYYSNYDTYFIEISGYHHFKRTYFNKIISHNSSHNYSISLDTVTGYWHYYLDTVLIDSLKDVHDFWMTKKGNYSVFSGEILNEYDDMPGTINDPCYIYNCFITSSNSIWGTMYVDFTGPAIFFAETDTTGFEWEVQPINLDTLSIWDVSPHP